MTSEEIKQNTHMPYVISQMYGIPMRGNMCRCPFHDDRSPSMKVFEDGAHCFTCNKSWDIFSFVADMEHTDFKGAFRILGGTYDRSGNDVERYGRQRERERQRAEAERLRQEERRQFREIAKALTVCQVGIKVYEPLSDEWCYFQNQLPIMYGFFDGILLDHSMEYDIDVHRKCEQIINKGLSVTCPVL